MEPKILAHRLTVLLVFMLLPWSIQGIGYQLQRSTNISGPYSFLATTTTNNYADTNVMSGMTYYYIIAAFDSGGYSTNSAPVMASTRTNAAPTLDTIADVATNMNALLQNIILTGISAGADETRQALTVTATSSNPVLIPNPPVVYTNSNASGVLSFAPVANATGSAEITVTVRDNGGVKGGGVDTVTRTFAVNITSALAFAEPVLSAEMLGLRGDGGLPGGSYTVLTSTNLTLAMTNWMPVLTNFFGNDGSFSNAIAVTPAEPLRFYRLRANP